jgi:L-ascorbate metabolism protein UlaG (beta-lactamase superfamily)
MITGNSSQAWLMWLGHASFLGSLGGSRFLIDPVFSAHAGWLYRRFLPPAVRLEDLPAVAAVLVTHNHYDHLDAAVYRSLPDVVPVIVPIGMGRWMRGCGRTKVIELEWWQSNTIGDLEVTLVPACHWSRRGVLDTNRVLWGGYVIDNGDHRIYHSGDSAAFDGFAQIGRRFPHLDAALLPIGAYDPPWFMEHYHLNPEQAGEAFLELGATRLVPMHWGTFQLTDEPLCEPIDRMRDWWRTLGPTDHRRLTVFDVGETVVLDGSGG